MSDFGPMIDMQWDGESLVPSSPRWQIAADRQLIVGQSYQIREHAERTSKDHNHYFGCIKKAWENLPESFANDLFARSPEHLRKYALIKEGYADAHQIPCPTAGEAMRLSATLKPIDEYSIVISQGSIVTRYTAQSQSRKEMGNEVFKESKQKVLAFCADLIAVDFEEFTDTSEYKRSAA